MFKSPKVDQPASARAGGSGHSCDRRVRRGADAGEHAFTGHVGIDHHQPLRKLVVSSNNPTGMPLNFESLDADGTHRPYSNVAGLTGGLKIATARDDGTGMSLGGFSSRRVVQWHRRARRDRARRCPTAQRCRTRGSHSLVRLVRKADSTSIVLVCLAEI